MQTTFENWQQIKASYPDAVVLCRGGDLYETFNEDARTLARVSRVKSTLSQTVNQGAIETVQFTVHTLDIYLNQLVKAGKWVAVADVLETKPIKKK